MNKAEKHQLLVDNYLDFFSYAMVILHDEQDARDAVQEALVNVMVKNEQSDLVNYTLQTVRNCAIDILRYRRNILSLDRDLPDYEAAYEERLREVGRLRDELPKELKSIVELHDEEGLSMPKLSAKTGISISTLWRRLKDAHKILKQRIENEI